MLLLNTVHSAFHDFHHQTTFLKANNYHFLFIVTLYICQQVQCHNIQEVALHAYYNLSTYLLRVVGWVMFLKKTGILLL
jgi:hypothetical protein